MLDLAEDENDGGCLPKRLVFRLVKGGRIKVVFVGHEERSYLMPEKAMIELLAQLLECLRKEGYTPRSEAYANFVEDNPDWKERRKK